MDYISKNNIWKKFFNKEKNFLFFSIFFFSFKLLSKIKKHIISNMADENVFNYKYDYIVNNNGTKEELKNKCIEFIEA